MKYYRFNCSNGYPTCDEEIYDILEDDENVEAYANIILHDKYSFAEPDGRFLDGASDIWDTDYEGYEEEYDEYVENLSIDWEEITEEEYKEGIGEY
jgi:hypothetical protein